MKFVKDYAAAGLKKTIPLYGPGFLTDGTLEAQGAAAQGMLDHAALRRRPGHAERTTPSATRLSRSYKLQPDVYAVQGYDAAQLLAVGLMAVKGDIAEARRSSSPRCAKAEDRQPARPVHDSRRPHNPVQDIYLREVEGGDNKFVTVAHASLADPARGCKMSLAHCLPRSAQHEPERMTRHACRADPTAVARFRREGMDSSIAWTSPAFLVQCLNGVQYGLLLFLVASGLTLIFGIMGVINLAHGSFYMLGAYLAFCARAVDGGSFCRWRCVGGVALAVAVRLPARVGVLQLPLRARPPAAGAADLRR